MSLEKRVVCGSGGQIQCFYIAKQGEGLAICMVRGFSEFEGSKVSMVQMDSVSKMGNEIARNYNPDFIIGLTNQFRIQGSS